MLSALSQKYKEPALFKFTPDALELFKTVIKNTFIFSCDITKIWIIKVLLLKNLISPILIGGFVKMAEHYFIVYDMYPPYYISLKVKE